MSELKNRLDFAIRAATEAGHLTIPLLPIIRPHHRNQTRRNPSHPRRQRIRRNPTKPSSQRVPKRRHSRRRIRHTIGINRLHLVPRPYRRHQIIHPRHPPIRNHDGTRTQRRSRSRRHRLPRSERNRLRRQRPRRMVVRPTRPDLTETGTCLEHLPTSPTRICPPLPHAASNEPIKRRHTKNSPSPSMSTAASPTATDTT